MKNLTIIFALLLTCFQANAQSSFNCQTYINTLQITSSVQYPCQGTAYVLTATPGYHLYHWQDQFSGILDTITSSNQLPGPPNWGLYYCTGFDSINGICNNGSITLSSINGTGLSTDYICGVSTDANNHNVITWEKHQPNLSGYVVNNDFGLVGQIGPNGFSQIVDTLSDARKKSYTYYLVGLDMNGCMLGNNGGVVSTIHLQSSIGQNNLRNIEWNEYSVAHWGSIGGTGYDFYYHIWVGTDTANMVLTDSIRTNGIMGTGTVYLWTDVNAPMVDTYYQIEVPSMYSSCTPSNKMETASSTIKSNIARCSPNLLLISVENKIKVFGVSDAYTLKVFNTLGQEMENNNLKSGIYIARVKYQNKEFKQKVFVQ